MGIFAPALTPGFLRAENMSFTLASLDTIQSRRPKQEVLQLA
jgi:hypothetical protein